MRFLLIFFIFLATTLATTRSAWAHAPLMEGWEYRWENTEDIVWRSHVPDKPPPGRDGREVLRYRVRLPSPLPPGTTLLIPGAYQHLEIDGQHYVGSAFHMVPLAAERAGQYLEIRVFSEFRNIGITGEMYLGTAAEHLRYIMRKDLVRVLLGAFFAFIGVFQFFLFRRRSGFVEYLAFGGFCLAYGIHAIARTQFRQLIFDDPLMWKYVEILTVLVLPIGLLLFIEKVFGAGPRRALRRLWQLNAVFVLAVAPTTFFGVGVLEHVLAVFNYMFVPGCLLMTLIVVPRAMSGDRDAGVFAFGMLCVAIPGSIDAMVVAGQIPWIDPLSPYGVMGFVFALQTILSRRLAAERHDKFVLERELETAAILSSTFLPPASATDARFQLEAVFRPAAQIGGDWFAYYLHGGRYLHAHIGDVTGHGPASALLAAYAKGATDAFYAEHAARGVASVPLEQLHRNLDDLLRHAETPAFMTLFSIALDLESGRLAYVNSGHMFQFVCSPSAGRNAVLTGKGRGVLGAPDPDADLGLVEPQRPDLVALNGDETIYMFSDGLLEAFGLGDGRGQKLFYEHLKAGSQEDPKATRDRILAALDAGLDPTAGPGRGKRRPGKADDVTFLVIKLGFTPVRGRMPGPATPPNATGQGQTP